MIKKYTSEVSFLDSQYGNKMSKFFLFPTAKFFTHHISFKNTLLQKLLKLNEAIILSSNTPSNHNIRALLEELKQAGFIFQYTEATIFCDYPKINYVAIQFSIINQQSSALQYAWGFCLPDESKELAFSKALGESLERHASYHHPNSVTAKFPAMKRGDASFLFPHIPKFTSNQYSNNPQLAQSADCLTNTIGMKVPSLTGDKSRFLPFEVMHWGHKADKGQKIIFDMTTNGCGGGSTRTQAILSGWYELIERDLFLLYWFSGIAPNRILNTSLPKDLAELVKNCEENYQLQVFFLDLQYDLSVLTSVCVIVDPVLKRISLGAKSGQNGETVLRGAFSEALAILHITRNKGDMDAELALKKIQSEMPFMSSVSHHDRLGLYASTYGINVFTEKFLTGKEVGYDSWIKHGAEIHDPESELEHLTSEFKKLVATHGIGYHTYVHTYTSKWLNKLDYHAIRIFVPSFLKLHLNENVATPVSQRLVDFANHNGKILKLDSDINPLPHPFP